MTLGQLGRHLHAATCRPISYAVRWRRWSQIGAGGGGVSAGGGGPSAVAR